jgi:starch synthase (maltosyl-transferring)
MLPFIARLNHIRRENPALQVLTGLTFLETHNEGLIAYAKQHAGNTVICVVNLDPHHANEGAAIVPAHLGLPPVFNVTDLLSGERFDWRIGHNYVRLEPWARQAHVFRVEP